MSQPIQPKPTNPFPNAEVPKIVVIEESVKNLYTVLEQKLTVLDSLGKTVATIDNLVKDNIQKMAVPKEVKDIISFIWEYVFLYIVILFSVGAAFGWISFTNFDAMNFSKLGFALISCILIGFIKTQYQNWLQSKDKNISSLKSENESIKTALNTNAFLVGNLQAELKAIKDFCHQKLPEFETQFIWNPKYQLPLSEKKEN